MRADDKNEAYLVFSRGNALERQTIDPNLVFRPLKRFPSATVSDEVFVIYRVHARSQADSN